MTPCIVCKGKTNSARVGAVCEWCKAAVRAVRDRDIRAERAVAGLTHVACCAGWDTFNESTGDVDVEACDSCGMAHGLDNDDDAVYHVVKAIEHDDAPMISTLIARLSKLAVEREAECRRLYADLDETDANALDHLNNRGRGLDFFYRARRSLRDYMAMWGDRESLASERMWM